MTDRVKKKRIALPWVTPNLCEGCSDCVSACPVHGLEMWETENEGIFIPWLSNPDACIGCGKCEEACTWNAISITTYVEDARLRLLTKRPKNLIVADEKRKFNLREAASSKVAMILCMDCKLHLEEILQNNTANAYILRNAGVLIGDSEIRSLIFATEILGVKEIYLIGHRDCKIRNADIRAILESVKKKYIKDADEGKERSIKKLLKGFKDPEANLVKQAEAIKKSEFISKDIPVHGIMYEEFTGNIVKIFI